MIEMESSNRSKQKVKDDLSHTCLPLLLLPRHEQNSTPGHSIKENCTGGGFEVVSLLMITPGGG